MVKGTMTKKSQIRYSAIIAFSSSTAFLEFVINNAIIVQKLKLTQMSK